MLPMPPLNPDASRMAPALSDKAQGMLLGAALTAGVGAALLSLRKRKGGPASDAAVRQAIVEALEQAKASRPEVKLPHQVRLLLCVVFVG